MTLLFLSSFKIFPTHISNRVCEEMDLKDLLFSVLDLGLLSSTVSSDIPITVLFVPFWAVGDGRGGEAKEFSRRRIDEIGI